jgi:hypothetical protein
MTWAKRRDAEEKKRKTKTWKNTTGREMTGKIMRKDRTGWEIHGKFISNILIVEKYLTVDGRQNKQEDRTRSARTRPETIRRRSRSSRSRARCRRRSTRCGCSTRSGRTKCQLTNWWTASHFDWRDVKGKARCRVNETEDKPGRIWLEEKWPEEEKERKWLEEKGPEMTC